MTSIFSQCINCTHLKGNDTSWVGKCDAFPEGIPEDILFNRQDHRLPIAGDHGIRWQAQDETLGHPLAEVPAGAEEETT